MNSLFGSLTHFGALLFFAFIVSLSFAFLSKQDHWERLKYFLWAFFAFLVVAVAIGWLMYPFSQ
jgi:hypothetical protein